MLLSGGDGVDAGLVAGAVGLLSAILSATLALAAIRSSRIENEEQRKQQVRLSLLPRQTNAFEVTWRSLFLYEAYGQLLPEQLDEVVACSMWLPRGLRDAVLALIAKEHLLPGDIREVRVGLINASGVNHVDKLFARLN
jgi:hypothetical protein